MKRWDISSRANSPMTEIMRKVNTEVPPYEGGVQEGMGVGQIVYNRM